MGARDRLRKYLEQHVGEIVKKEHLMAEAGISEWARRIRELRDEEGMDIRTHHDRDDLKPGDYVLASLKRKPRPDHKIDAKTWTRILERNGFTCQQCGRAGGDPHPLDPLKQVILHVDHIDPNGSSEDGNLRTLCSLCNQGRSNERLPPKTINVLASIRKVSKEDQLRVFEWLKRKFE